MTIRIDYQQVAPAGVKALGGVYAYVRQSGLPEALIELVYFRVSQINGCAYCLDLHAKALAAKGFSLSKLVLVAAWREAQAPFDARERAALAWAETVTRVAETAIPDEDFAAASAVFTEKELVELTIAIGLMNSFNRMAIAFRRPPGG